MRMLINDAVSVIREKRVPLQAVAAQIAVPATAPCKYLLIRHYINCCPSGLSERITLTMDVIGRGETGCYSVSTSLYCGKI